MARTNRVMVDVKYFVPCADEKNNAYGYRERYKTLSGMVLNVDAEAGETISLQADGQRIVLNFADILSVEGAGKDADVFETEWELDAP